VLKGAWSRKITEEHRLVYLSDGDDRVVLGTPYHYR
jgi:toxin YoeB